jgi:hypothetical protein
MLTGRQGRRRLFVVLVGSVAVGCATAMACLALAPSLRGALLFPSCTLPQGGLRSALVWLQRIGFAQSACLVPVALVGWGLESGGYASAMRVMVPSALHFAHAVCVGFVAWSCC